MQKTNMNLNNGIDAEVVMEWGLSLLEIIGDFVDVLKASVSQEEKEEDDDRRSICCPYAGCSESARVGRLLGYLNGILWPDDDDDDDWDDDDCDDDDWDDEDLDDEPEEIQNDCRDNSPAEDDDHNTGKDPNNGDHGSRHYYAEVDILTKVIVLEPGGGATVMSWAKAMGTYPGIFTDRMSLACFDKADGYCYIRSGNEYVPDGTRVCLRGPVIALKVSKKGPVNPDYLDICCITRFFEGHTETERLSDGSEVKVFCLRKGVNDGSERI